MAVKSIIRLVRRKMRSNIPHLAGLIALLTVGVGFYIVLSTIASRYDETVEKYFIDQSYADATFYGTFNDESLKLLLSEEDRILSVDGRNVRDFRDKSGDRIFRVISLTEGVNTPYIYDGRLPSNEKECVLLKRNAKAMGLSIGDTLMLGDKTLVITGLIASPEYIYMVQNERTVMAHKDRFGVVYVTKEFYPEENSYNEITVLTNPSSDFSVSVSELSELISAFRALSRKDQTNHILYKSNSGHIRTFSYIFPFIFAALIAVVIYVMLSRTIQKDRTQIGVMKALGVSDARIIAVYLSQFCFAALIGALLGCVAAIPISDLIIYIFSAMFEVPELSYAFYPNLWAGAFIVSVLLCVVSGLIALFSILPLLPAHAMRPRAPKSGRRIFLERAGFKFLWKRFSFNTRYALKNSLRNKGRFCAVVLGMCGSCALLAFSLGFYNSIGNTQDKYFDEFANYDVIINFDPIPRFLKHPALDKLDESYKALIIPVEINGESYRLTIVENIKNAEKDFDMVKIPGDALKNGVIIPEYFASEWGVEVGGELTVSGYNAAVSAIIPQYLGLSLYTGADYISTIATANKIPAVYNTIYGKSEAISSLSLYLKENNVNFTTIEDDKTCFDSVMDTMSVLIWFLIACSIVLGVAVLYSVGLINLSAREYEYMFMGVMGYPRKSILAAHIKETIIQLVLAIPTGFLLGNFLLESIKGEFSGSNFVIAAAIYPQSYIIAALSVICVTALMALVTSRHIEKLDIVEGLKARDD